MRTYRRRGLIFVPLALFVATAVWWASSPAPPLSFEEVRSRWVPSDAQLVDREGNPLYEMRLDPYGRRFAWTRLSEISPALIKAVVASEDRRFYAHHGVDFRALAGAALNKIVARRPRGASTITMQLASIIEPGLGRDGRRRSFTQKLDQIRAAIALETRWTKRQILEAYLNQVTWRGEVQGVSAASRLMFGKTPDGIDMSEAVVMAALLRAPNAHRAVVERRALKLRPMLDETLSARQISAALDGVFSRHRGNFERVELAPHVAQLLRVTGERSAVRCTLDSKLQRFTLLSLRQRVAEVRDRGVDDGAVLVVDNATGEVLAYVGSTGDISGAPWVDSVRATRQPGSTLKPFLYALALDRRLLTPASLLEDSPLELPEERGLYRPMDYDHRFRGLVSLRTALGSSLNVPAVRTGELVGIEAFANRLRALGLNTIVEDADFYGAALALGSADVTLWDLTNAYRTLANGGTYSPLRLQPGISEAPLHSLYSPQAAFLISDILADRVGRSATFGLENSLATRYWSAVKTGTSKDMRDNWCLGYTDRFTVGVWVGNATGAPMRDVTGITGAAPVWLDVMNYLYDRFGSAAIEPPRGVVSHRVIFPNSIEPERNEWFIDGTEPATLGLIDQTAPRISSPANGSIIALDPDIPPDLQRVMFDDDRRADGAHWLLDEHPQCGGTAPCSWRPTPGRHSLTLVDREGKIFDHVSFLVRGLPKSH